MSYNLLSSEAREVAKNPPSDYVGSCPYLCMMDTHPEHETTGHLDMRHSCNYFMLSILLVTLVLPAEQSTVNLMRNASGPDQNAFDLSSSCILRFESEGQLNRLTIFSRYVTPVLFGLYFILGFVGNLFVIIVILANAQMRNTTNILVFSLAIADMTLVILCIPPTGAVYLTGTWPLGNVMCHVFWYSTYVSIYCIAYTLLLMSLDRFLAVVYPMKFAAFRKEGNMIKAVVAIWITTMLSNVSLLFNSMIVYGSAEGGDSPCATRYCTYSWLVQIDPKTGIAKDNFTGAQTYFTLFFLFGYLIPFTLITGLYITVIFRLRCRKSPHIKPSVESQRSRKRITRMVVTVVVAFGISWLPIHVIFLHQYYVGDPNTDWYRMIQIACNCLAYGHSCVNPILYAFLSATFRKAFITLFRGRRTFAVTAGHTNNDTFAAGHSRMQGIGGGSLQQPTNLGVDKTDGFGIIEHRHSLAN
ncbi:7 transmembrane receptor [Opisthorchis viverrini]|uniref:7 transmembrane receptor n=1 Tax=Opisthorchis viverrini TaxID=6198 RepID=A0A1S8X749_OPIVI|nr:7 transmembrane receptor [Opisthorchis viverrini]